MKALKTILVQAIRTLSQADSQTPRLDAEVLLAHILQQNRSWLYAHSEAPLSAATERQFLQLIARRAQSEPVAYLTGEREFFGLTFHVSPAVLIPRPETELLVELALSCLPQAASLLDVGTGSGCIAVSVAVNAPTTRIIATDVSAGALAVARKNVTRHRVGRRVSLVQTNLLAPLSKPVDAIISNPPYISRAEMETLAPTVHAYEPRQALLAGETGLMYITKILQQAPMNIKPGGHLFIEFGVSQGAQVLSLARTTCSAASFTIKTDLAGRERVLIGEF